MLQLALFVCIGTRFVHDILYVASYNNIRSVWCSPSYIVTVYGLTLMASEQIHTCTNSTTYTYVVQYKCVRCFILSTQ